MCVFSILLSSRFKEDHIENSVSAPFRRAIETDIKLRVKGGLSGGISSEEATELNPDFVKMYKEAVQGAGEKTVILTCSRGGTMRTEVVSKRGKVFKDPQLKNGRESVSLRAMAALVDDGCKNLAHLNGGNDSWKEAKLPVIGSFFQKIQGENAVGWRIATYFEEEGDWLKGKVTAFKGDGKYAVKYDMNEAEEDLNLDMNKTRWLNKQGETKKLTPLPKDENLLMQRPRPDRPKMVRKNNQKRVFFPYF